ncbi:11513_t:CDS:1, partial [Racocetra persica]
NEEKFSSEVKDTQTTAIAISEIIDTSNEQISIAVYLPSASQNKNKPHQFSEI